MKVYIMLVFLLAAALGASMVEKDGNLHFEGDSHPESPIGLFMKGQVNPRNEAENNVQTFFRLAEQLIPLAESAMKDQEPGNLKWYRRWCYGQTGQAFSVCLYVNAELWVGWKVSQLGETGSYNVTYTPYTIFRAGGNATASSYPAQVAYGGYVSLVNIHVPVNLLLAQTQICYSAKFTMMPARAYTSITTDLLECYRSVPDLTDWMCNTVNGAEFIHLEWDFTNGLYLDLLPYSCINF